MTEENNKGGKPLITPKKNLKTQDY